MAKTCCLSAMSHAWALESGKCRLLAGEARLLNQFGENSSSIAVARDGARLVYSKENKIRTSGASAFQQANQPREESPLCLP